MKKFLIAGIVVAVLVAVGGVFLTVNIVKAQQPTPEVPFGSGWGMWMHGGRSFAGGGTMHDAMVAAFAEKLGMTAEELQARLDEGDTMWQIAEEKDMTLEEFRTAMTDAQAKAVDQAVADGRLTEEQGEWMKNNGGHMFGGGMPGGRGGCHGGGYGGGGFGGMMGGGGYGGMMGGRW